MTEKIQGKVIEIIKEIADKTGYTFHFDDVDIGIEDKTIKIKGNL